MNRLATAPAPSSSPWHAEFQSRVKEVYGEASALGEMATDTLEGSKLFFQGEDVLEGRERDDDERELLAELELSHVALDKRDALLHFIGKLGDILPRLLKHPWRDFEPHHLGALLGKVACHPSRPYGKLQYWSAELLGELMIELAVVAPDKWPRVERIVEVYHRFRVLKELLHRNPPLVEELTAPR